MKASPRVASIDCFRGFAVMTMALSSHLFTVDALPAWLRHAPDGRLTFPDLAAPWFIFAIGLTYGTSLRRRWKRDGPVQVFKHFACRSVFLFVIGFIGAFVQTSAGRNEGGIYWGVLQTIALAIALTFPFLLLPTLTRAVIALGLLAVYQIAMTRLWLGAVLAAPHGGLPGSLGWTSLLILSTVFGDQYFVYGHRKASFAAAGLAALAAGMVLLPFVSVSKLRVSASYVLISLGVSVLIFFLFHLLTECLDWQFPGFATWGRNPLALYLLHYMFIALLVLPPIPGWHAQAPFWLIVAQAFALIGALTTIAYTMERRGWIISL